MCEVIEGLTEMKFLELSFSGLMLPGRQINLGKVPTRGISQKIKNEGNFLRFGESLL
jgi:hypothetical protein